MAEIVRRALERLHSQLKEKKLELESNLDCDSRPVMADAGQIEQVLYNLLHNAIKFTPAGGRVSISTRPDSASMLITVSDTGAGISPEDLPRVFERFFKADRSRSSGGTGLGLAIARHIVEAHGGRIWAESPAGQGTRIHFRLPV
jgi:two-component system phosphate regulon sensor histidine kinase PhoR